MPRVFKVLSALVLLCCALEALQAADFLKAEVQGRVLTLIDEQRFETYRFTPSGGVLAVIGTRGGALAGPAYRWKIEKGKLFILQGTFVKERFELLSRKDGLLRVRRLNGKVEDFRLLSADAPR